jgi:hypothetical protein
MTPQDMQLVQTIWLGKMIPKGMVVAAATSNLEDKNNRRHKDR